MSNSNTYWSSEFKVRILSKPNVSLEEFNASLDKFVEAMVDEIPASGTADAESAISGWNATYSAPVLDEWSEDDEE